MHKRGAFAARYWRHEHIWKLCYFRKSRNPMSAGAKEILMGQKLIYLSTVTRSPANKVVSISKYQACYRPLLHWHINTSLHFCISASCFYASASPASCCCLIDLYTCWVRYSTAKIDQPSNLRMRDGLFVGSRLCIFGYRYSGWWRRFGTGSICSAALRQCDCTKLSTPYLPAISRTWEHVKFEVIMTWHGEKCVIIQRSQFKEQFLGASHSIIHLSSRALSVI